ncbi:MAG: T9SS type A sorting domain-containing protein [Bacteroidota bacterium]|nr:T9SS type A sorting domain-containing protein [Bacteroidota bacterium]
MKKQLLFGSALLAAVTAFSQNNGSKAKPSGIINMAEKLAAKYSTSATEPQGAAKLNTPASTEVSSATAKEAEVLNTTATSISWKAIAGSMNVYGQLVSQSRPLQYNDNVNAVSFVHRKSSSYVGFPASNSGNIVAEVSTNWGSTWDSTCVWGSGTDVGRYPQGGIYNPVGNTNIANAYIVACGPTTDGASTWTGNFYGSKQLSAFNATSSSVPNAQQLLSVIASTYAINQAKHGWSRYGFSSTDDGVVRSLGLVQDDQQGLSTMRGAAVVKGSFSAGVFNWTTDTLIPNTINETSGAKNLYSAPQMVWNESGTIGYVVFIGASATGTLSTRGWQPIVYKTTNSGASWAQISGIDFNNSAFNPIKASIATVNTNTALEVPFFNIGEGFDCVVDASGKLHIASTIVGTASTHQDSLSYTFSFTTSINPSDSYQWPHTPGSHPYLYDFIGDGTGAWTYKLIDSLSSEGPSSDPAGNGFSENAWDNTGTGGAKIEMDARIQLGRTPDGQFITYSWAESDSNITNGTKKWNNLPNIKTRLLNASTGSLSATEINVSKVAVGQGTNNPNVANRATLHYMSPTTGAAVLFTTSTTYTAEIKTPFTVTNSNPYSQLTNNVTYYSSNTLAYTFGGSPVSIKDNASATSALNSMIYPNPTKDNAVLAIDVKENATVTVLVYNLVGALVKTISANAVVGANSIDLDLTNLTSGVYLANVKVGNSVSTKKLIIE